MTNKYGKEFAESARTASGNHRVSEKLMHKLAVQAPPKLLVEKYFFPNFYLKKPFFLCQFTCRYLIEIARSEGIEYEPDPQVMLEDSREIGLTYFNVKETSKRTLELFLGMLIDLSDRNNLGGGGGSAGPPQPNPVGFIGYPQAPPLPQMPMPPTTPFNYPMSSNKGNTSGGGGGGSGGMPVPFAYNIPPNAPPNDEKKDLNINTEFLNVRYCDCFSTLISLF